MNRVVTAGRTFSLQRQPCEADKSRQRRNVRAAWQWDAATVMLILIVLRLIAIVIVLVR
jgi:hypothetical protein